MYGLYGFGQTPSPPTGRPTVGIAPQPGPRPLPTATTMTADRPMVRIDQTTTTTEAGPVDTAKSWWSSQSSGVKAAVVGGGFVLVAGLLYLLFGGSSKSSSYKPNRRRRRRRAYARNRKVARKAQAARKPRKVTVKGERAKARRGKIITVKGGRRFGHQIPPKRYHAMGAKKPSDYAWPSGYKYPLIFRKSSGDIDVPTTKKHIRAAKVYFSRNKHLYPANVRATIARNINKASKRFNVGPTVMKP